MKSYEFIELKEEDFDPNTIVQVTPFTQAIFYGKWQEKMNREVKRFIVKKNNKKIAYFQIIKYKLFFNKSYFYIPYGPITTDITEDFLKALKDFISKLSKENNIVFTRFDFTPSIPENTIQKFFKKSPKYSYYSAYFQPRLEWFLKLDKSLDEILMNMHEKTRYSIRLSERKDIKVEIINKDFQKYFDNFYELMNVTAKRNGFSIHDKQYYQIIFNDLPKIQNSFLSVASFYGKVLAIDLVIPFGGIANYVFGASSNEERNRMPAYLAQWKAIIESKRIGCTHYNFGAITDEKMSKSGWEGITAFKKKFGGEEVIHSVFYDHIEQTFWYNLYNFRKIIKRIKL